MAGVNGQGSPNPQYIFSIRDPEKTKATGSGEKITARDTELHIVAADKTVGWVAAQEVNTSSLKERCWAAVKEFFGATVQLTLGGRVWEIDNSKWKKVMQEVNEAKKEQGYASLTVEKAQQMIDSSKVSPLTIPVEKLTKSKNDLKVGSLVSFSGLKEMFGLEGSKKGMINKEMILLTPLLAKLPSPQEGCYILTEEFFADLKELALKKSNFQLAEGHKAMNHVSVPEGLKYSAAALKELSGLGGDKLGSLLKKLTSRSESHRTFYLCTEEQVYCIQLQKALDAGGTAQGNKKDFKEVSARVLCKHFTDKDAWRLLDSNTAKNLILAAKENRSMWLREGILDFFKYTVNKATPQNVAPKS